MTVWELMWREMPHFVFWCLVLFGCYWIPIGSYKWRRAREDGLEDREYATRDNDYHLGLFRFAYELGYRQVDRDTAEHARIVAEERRRIRRRRRRARQRNP